MKFKRIPNKTSQEGWLAPALCMLIVLVGNAASASAQTPSPSPWRTYIMKQEELSFELPVFPSTRTTKEKRDGPQPDRQRRVFDSSADGVDYEVYVIENPEPRQTLDAFIKEESSKSKWDDASARDLTLNGVNGKAFVYRNGKGMVQFFATETHLFEFRARGAPVDDARVTKFFASISLKKIPETTATSLDSNAGEQIYKGADVQTKARMTYFAEPKYTPEADKERINGTVILRCVFRSDGSVTNIQVLKGLPYGLTEKSIEAAKRIKFIPATKNGKPVSMWIQLEYNFNLYGIR